MNKTKAVKDAAILIGAVAGIVTGLDKIKTTLQKWKMEYNDRKFRNPSDKGTPR